MSLKQKLLIPHNSYLIKLLPPIVFFLISLLFFVTHYKSGYLILRGDTGYPLDPEIFLKNHAYAWFDSYMNGQPAGHAFNFAFPLVVMIFVLNKLFAPDISQFILLAFLLFLIGYLSYFFFSKINKNNTLSNCLAALFYTLNPIIITEWYVPNPWFLLAYAAMPLVAIGCYYLTTNFVKGVSFLAFSYVFIASSFANVPLLGINFLFGILLIFYFCIQNNNSYKKIFFYIASYILIFFIANSWWLGSLFLYREEGYQVLTKGVGVSDWVRSASRRSHLIYVFQTQFTPTIAGKSWGYTQILTNPLLSWIFMIFPMVIFGYLFRKNREYKLIPLMFFILIIIFFTKGTQLPFGSIYDWLLRNMPYFAVFKTPPEKFGIMLIFFSAMALSMINLQKKVIYPLIFILLAFSYPIYLGFLFPDINISKDFKLKAYQKVDHSYFAIAQIINADQMVGRVLLLPASLNYMDTYLSNGFRGIPWSTSLINKPLIKGYNSQRDNLGNLIKSLGNEKKFIKLLKFYNINWVLLNKDIDKNAYGFAHNESVEEIEANLNSYKNLKRVSFQGYLVLYRLNKIDEKNPSNEFNPLPHIYSPSKVDIYISNHAE